MSNIPFVSGSDTSEEAAKQMAPTVSLTRVLVFNFIRACGSVVGSTCDEAEEALGLNHQTCSPRFTELRNAGAIADSGMRRRTRSGRSAVVYVPSTTWVGNVADINRTARK